MDEGKEGKKRDKKTLTLLNRPNPLIRRLNPALLDHLQQLRREARDREQDDHGGHAYE
jgi:hypothetical protein